MATEPNFKDRLLWTLVSAAAVAVAATLAQRTVGYLWARTTHKPDPKPLPLLLSHLTPVTRAQPDSS